jgi:hypothetical protein
MAKEIAAVERDREVVKHSAAIQIQNNITLLQRRAWNVLLYHAYDELLSETLHSIPTTQLCNDLEYNSHNDEYLKESLYALTTCGVEWNILKKDGKGEWGITTLLASATLEDGICTYEFSRKLSERLHNPTMYARLSLSMQNRFDSKYAQALWELSVDYLGSGREFGETAYIAVEDFRKLMGIPPGSYAGMKKLNQKILKPALAEINKVSDLRVTVDCQRKGRKVAALKFKIRRVVSLPEASDHQQDLFPAIKDAPVVHLLKEAGLSSSDAWDVWQKGFDFVVESKRPAFSDDDRDAAFLGYVREKIDLLRQRDKEGKVQNRSGFLLTALKENYTNAEYEKRAATQQRADKMKQLRQLLKDRERLTKGQDNALEALCNQLIELPGQVEKAVAALETESDFARWYDKDRSALENYRKNRPVNALMAQWLEGQFPEQFETVYHLYRDKLAAIDAQIAAFEEEGISAKYLR